MILGSENTTTENGARIHSSVNLDIDAIGVAECPFRLTADDGTTYVRESYPTAATARKERVRVHRELTRVNCPSLSR